MARPKQTSPPWPVGLAILVLVTIVAGVLFFAGSVELPKTTPAPNSIPAQIPLR